MQLLLGRVERNVPHSAFVSLSKQTMNSTGDGHGTDQMPGMRKRNIG